MHSVKNVITDLSENMEETLLREAMECRMNKEATWGIKMAMLEFKGENEQTSYQKHF